MQCWWFYLFGLYQNIAYNIIHKDNLHPVRLKSIKLLRRKCYLTGQFDLLELDFANSVKKNMTLIWGFQPGI